MMMADNVRNAKMDSNFIPIALVKSIQLILACGCDTQGSVSNGTTCTNDGQCKCKPKMEGLTCNRCKDGFYDFPKCKGNSKSQSLLFFNWFIFQKLVSVMTKEERITFLIKKLETAIVKTTLKEPFVMNALRIIVTFWLVKLAIVIRKETRIRLVMLIVEIARDCLPNVCGQKCDKCQRHYYPDPFPDCKGFWISSKSWKFLINFDFRM